jgi:hypothetical protein
MKEQIEFYECFKDCTIQNEKLYSGPAEQVCKVREKNLVQMN